MVVEKGGSKERPKLEDTASARIVHYHATTDRDALSNDERVRGEEEDEKEKETDEGRQRGKPGHMVVAGYFVLGIKKIE